MQKAGAVLLPSPLASGLPWFASFCWEKKKKKGSVFEVGCISCLPLSTYLLNFIGSP